MDTISAALPFPVSAGMGSFTVNSLLKVAAASLASPMTEKQSGLFEVISNSIIFSSSPSSWTMSVPGSMYLSRMNIPSSMALG